MGKDYTLRQFNFNMYATEFQDSLQVIFLILYAMMWTLSIAPARLSLLYQDFRKIAISIVFIFYFFDIVSMEILTAKPETK